MILIDFLTIEIDRAIREFGLTGVEGMVHVWEDVYDGQFDHVLSLDQTLEALDLIATALTMKKLEHAR